MAAAPHTLDARPRHRAQRLHADGGQGRLRPLGPRARRAAHVLLDPDLDRRARRRRRQARPAAREGRVHRPRRGRRLRRQDHAPVARGGPRALGREAARPPRSSGPRTGASTSSPPRTSAGSSSEVTVGFDDEGRLLALDVQVLARQRRLHALRHHRPDHHLDPAARPLQAGRLPLRVLVALHQHRPRDALPRRRPAAGRASRWSARWTPSPTSSASTAPRCARATSSSRARCPTTTACSSRTAGR